MNVERLNPISEEEAAAMVSRQTRDDLAERIMTAPPDEAPAPVRHGRWGRRLLVGVPLAAVVAAAGVVVFSVAGPDQKVGPVSLGPNRADAAALSFRKEGGSLVVTVKDPVADPARYRKEFAAHGLNIELDLKPVSPRNAGTVVFLEDQEGSRIEVIQAEGECGVEICNVGVKVPVDYKGYAHIIFGREARPGEMYDTGPGDRPGEGVGLPEIPGRTMAEAWDVLAERKITDVEYRYEFRGSDRPYPNGLTRDQVKPEWYVRDALAGSEGQVILFVSPEKE
ncbi:hypothetical protein [Microtetraspora fusca]|uniref:hypothetical protein n=1 Tax=Microtetraspora fusca TaxID=1997 RepID=UPI0008362980|nr:hypothetical protein [Microtetraspora fusca]